jgi:ribosomal protein S27E
MIMRRAYSPRPTTDLFDDSAVLDAIELYRHGAFAQPMHFPFRRLRTDRDHVERSWPDRNKPATVILVEHRPLHLGGAFPYFRCPQCAKLVRILYASSIDVSCRVCSDLQFASQRQRRKARLTAKARRIRNRLWSEAGKPVRPHFMHRKTFDSYVRTLHRIEHAAQHGSHCASVRYRRERERDEDGRLCD